MITRLPLILLAAIATLALLPAAASAQSTPAPPPASGLYVTGFRSPATGLEVRAGRLGVHAGFYPTIIKTDAQSEGENTNFVRAGLSWYLRSHGWTPYVTVSGVLSLDDDWDDGVLNELGVRVPVFARTQFRIGVGVLRTFDGETRVNPTVGFDIRLGRR